MARKSLRYPHALELRDIPAAAMDAARHETFRFLFTYGVWKGDLHHLCALCYLQGAVGGAQVQQTLAQEDRPHA